jgi:uncharacterized protein (DUF2147 family)
MMKLAFLTSILFTSIASLASESADDIVGIWKNASGKGHVQIYKQNGKYYGKLVWLRKTHDEQGLPYLDKNNPDKTECMQPLLGLVMLKDFQFDDGEWKGGKVYNPEDGKEYKSYMKLKDSHTLFVRGFLGFSWIGKTLTFQRVK